MGDLKKGSKGKDVEELQKLLNKAGAKPPLKVDGWFGPVTEGQVKVFQKKCKLSGDGRVGDTTMAAARYGGPLPEMTIEDYKPKLAKYEKAKDVNETTFNAYAKIAALIEGLHNSVSKHVADAEKALAANKALWPEVINASKFIVDAQARFETLRKKDPFKAEELLDECYKQLDALNAAGKKTSPNVQDLTDNCDFVRTRIEDVSGSISAEVEKSRKALKEYKSLR